MGVLVTTADFTGVWALPQNVYSDLDAYISAKESTYLVELLGAEFYTAFVADLSSRVPQTTRFLNIYNAFNEDYECELVISKGMKEMLKNFLFFDFMRYTQFKQTQNGQVVNSADTSRNVGIGSIYNYHNDGIVTYQAIQKYIDEINASTYSDLNFNGVKKNIAIPFF